MDILAAVRPYLKRGPLAALFLGMSSGFPFAMIGATLTTRLAEDGLSKSTVTAFGLTLLVYNLKVLWSPLVERMRLPLLGGLGQRRSWLVLSALGVMAAVAWLGALDPTADLELVALAAVTVAFWGATYDIVIDAYRTELLDAGTLGAGAGMSQYGWRLGAFFAGSLALLLADGFGWGVGYAVAALFALPAAITGLVIGEPPVHRAPPATRGFRLAVVEPIADFLRREGAVIILLFIVIHKLGDTLANLTVRLLLNDLGFTKPEIAAFDSGVGLAFMLIGIFIGGILYARLGLARTVMLSLILMAVSNLSFAWLAVVGKSNFWLAFTFAFENLSSGIGGVAIVAYISALTNLNFTATQFALLSAAASILGRAVSSLGGGKLIEQMGYVDFYLLTTAAALPGILLFAWMMRRGIVSKAIQAGPAARTDEAEAPHGVSPRSATSAP